MAAAAHNVGSHSALILDPTSHAPLTEAVSLSPCCHKVNVSTAIKLLEQMEASRRICPILGCKTEVTSYHPDTQMRAIAKAFFGIEPVPDKVATLPYPGIPAQFVDFRPLNDCYSGFAMGRPVCLQSQTPNSLLQNVYLVSKSLGNWGVLIEFDLFVSTGRSVKLLGYLKFVGITNIAKIWDDGDAYRVWGKEDMKMVLRILTLHNTVPPEWLKVLSSYVNEQ
jgi:hypothetical protein